MPAAQVALAQLNPQLGPDQIGTIDPALFEEGRLLSAALPDAAKSRVGFALDSLPLGLHEAIRSVLRTAVQRSLPVTITWAPGYDYRLTVWDVASTDQTHGGITILVESRYPDDPHPLHKATMQELAKTRRG